MPDDTILVLLNKVTVTPEDLQQVNNAANELSSELKADPFASMYVVARFYRGDWEKAMAVHFRMQALARFLKLEPDVGWTIPGKTDGEILAHDALIAAAAAEPLVEIEGSPAFLRESLLERCFQQKKHV